MTGVPSVEHQNVVGGFEIGQLFGDVRPEPFFGVPHVGQMPGSGNDVDSVRSVKRDVCQSTSAGEDVSEVPVSVESAHQVQVSEPEAGIEQTGTDTESGEGDGQVQGQAALANASLAAGDGNHCRGGSGLVGGQVPVLLLLDQSSQLASLVSASGLGSRVCGGCHAWVSVEPPPTEDSSRSCPSTSRAIRWVSAGSMSSGTSCPVVR